MLNQILTTDDLSLTRSSTADLEVHVSGVDVDTATGGVFTPWKVNTKFTTAATGDISTHPGAGFYRNTKWISIRNKHASASNDITVNYDAAGTLYELFKCTLLAGEEAVCHEGTWFHFDVTGAVYASGINITGAPAATSFLDADEFLVNEAGATKKMTGTLLKAWNGDMMQNQATAAQAISAATSTYITGSSLAIPVGKLRIGTRFLWKLDMSKGAVGTASRQFFVRLGTAGTVADTAIHTFTSALGTAVVDQAKATIEMTVRGPLSASCVSRAQFNMDHQLPATGFMTVKSEVLVSTSGSFDATVANLIIGLSVTTGAAETLSVEQCGVEAKNL